MLKPFWGQPEGNFILYMDILGGEKIIQSPQIGILSTVLDWTLKELKRAKQIHRADDVYFKMFSDNIIVCSENNYEFLLLIAAGWQKHLATFGIFLRGAICYGSVIKNTDFILGDGLVRAYKLENEHAKSPRVLVDKGFIDALSCKEASDSVYSRYLHRDTDDNLYVHYLKEANLTYDKTTMMNLLLEHTFRIKLNLFWNSEITEFTPREQEKNVQGSINKKYEWLRDYHNAFIRDNNYDSRFIIDNDSSKWRDKFEG
ncbi:MAG: hypothetical protein FWC77_05085 [Defluviitaleaceae bacterium]|nr:hypothetical protein [Defluviitaleaceae bacterium]